ncbi:MAG: SUMF1/EgtB/PvdO family nonheme iron enzyme [Anaerolineae bacterium]|nr:SUMF1/EgtB/PvdO family nonheme iron enzyme [Anaerolineae bacterium]
MADAQNTVFISYRRSTSMHLARLIFTDLKARGYDVFLDVNTIDSGAFDQIILNQIAARAHFILVLSRGALERCANEGDWLRREIEEAFWLNRNIVPIFDEGFNLDAEKHHLPELLRQELPRRNALPWSHYYYDAVMDTLRNRFLKEPMYGRLTPPPAADQPEVQRRIEQAAKLSSEKLLPAPFEWIEIPGGKVTLEEGGYVPKGGKTYNVEPFKIAKYPITNAQFALFVEAKGYENPDWWTADGWHIKQYENWKGPRYWDTAKMNREDYPVVGVSWYEAVAYCLWLSKIINQNIGLPTEQQWQRAAQGDTNWKYPWGSTFDESRCNFKPRNTTPVTHYPYGASPYGVMDMIGNVREWCLNKYFPDVPLSDGTDYRVLRGGSREFSISNARSASRERGYAHSSTLKLGFRVCCSLA